MPYKSHVTTNSAPEQASIVAKLFKRSPVLFIGLSFALIIGVMVALVMLSINRLGTMRTELEHIVNVHNEKIELVQTLRFVVRERMISMYRLVIEDDPFLRDEISMHFHDQSAQFVKAREKLQKMAQTDEERRMLDNLRKLANAGTPFQNGVVDLLSKNDMQGARKLLREKAMLTQLNVVKQCDDMLKYYKQVTLEVETKGNEAQQKGTFLLVMLGGFAASISVVTAVIVLKRIKEDREDLSIAATAFETQEGIMITDAQNVILRINQAFTDITGYTAEEAIGRMSSMLKSSRHDAAFYAAMWESIHRTGTWQGEIWNQRKTGEVFPEWLSITAMQGAKGNITHYVAMFTDITERKQSETDLIAAKEEAERASSAKTQFIASMSHEFRTPLNAILGFGQLLEMDADSATPDQQESVKYILSAGQQLLGLVNEILDLSRIEAGSMTLNMQPLRIADVTSTCVAQITATMANQKHITIENTITDPRLMVHGDDLRIRQVLINLLSNAVKYNKDNGQVTILGVLAQGGRLRIEVRDTGTGIASDKQSLLFNPFERIDQKHGKISGVGIGLHISKQLVEAMGGTVGVESVEGKGSTFWFDLPLAEETDEAAVA